MLEGMGERPTGNPQIRAKVFFNKNIINIFIFTEESKSKVCNMY